MVAPFLLHRRNSQALSAMKEPSPSNNSRSTGREVPPPSSLKRRWMQLHQEEQERKAKAEQHTQEATKQQQQQSEQQQLIECEGIRKQAQDRTSEATTRNGEGGGGPIGRGDEHGGLEHGGEVERGEGGQQGAGHKRLGGNKELHGSKEGQHSQKSKEERGGGEGLHSRRVSRRGAGIGLGKRGAEEEAGHEVKKEDGQGREQGSKQDSCKVARDKDYHKRSSNLRRPSLDDFEDALFTSLPPVSCIKPEPHANGSKKAYEQEPRGGSHSQQVPPHKRLKHAAGLGFPLGPSPASAAAAAAGSAAGVRGSTTTSAMQRKLLSEASAVPKCATGSKRPPAADEERGSAAAAGTIGNAEEEGADERPSSSATERPVARGSKNLRRVGSGSAEHSQCTADIKVPSNQQQPACTIGGGTGARNTTTKEGEGSRHKPQLMLECIIESTSSSSGNSAGAGTKGKPGSSSSVNPQGSHSATIHLGSLHSFDDLRSAVQAAFAPGLLPPQPQAKLVYLDSDGDWMLLTQDDHWASFCASARKLLVTDRC